MERLFRTISSFYPPELGVSESVVPFQSRGLLRRFGNILWARRQDATVFHVIGDVHYLVMALPKNRTVLTVHDCVGVLRNGNWLKRELIRWIWYILPVRRAAAVVAISEQTKRDLMTVARLPEGRIHVISNCIDPLFDFSPRDFNPDRPRLLQIGQSTNKNIPRLAAALEGIPCHLHIVGRIHDETRRALQAHHIDYSNSVDISFAEMRDEYRRADIVTFASTYEGFGLPILEAQSVGRPLVTSNIPPMSEVAGGAAMLVDPYDVRSIRSGILEVLSDAALRADLIERGLQNVTKYSPAAAAKAYESVYRQIMGTLQHTGDAK
jgi:glycosyltransferase involved in cell wall biosynthesis